MRIRIRIITSAVASVALFAGVSNAQVVPPPGYVYDAQLLSSTTQSCIAVGPGGTFVGIGLGFTANAQSVVLAKESGELRLVVSGFNSIGDCAYDAENDVLYVTDNADNVDLDITTGFAGNTGAQSGDTIFAVHGASSASGLFAPDVELLPADSIQAAGSVAVDDAGDVLVGNAVGVGTGVVTKITAGPSTSTFAGAFDFTGGIAVGAGGDVFVAENLASFENQITRFDTGGATVLPDPFAGPSFSFGSYDLAFNVDGRLLVSGVFGGNVVSFALDGSSQSFIGGLTFATGVAVDPLTGRVEVLSSTFTAAAEDKTVHRFVPVDRLVPGTGPASTECVHEFYGVELAGGSSNSVVCTDGAACDDDGTVNDRCSFAVGFCFNVDDVRFPECSSNGAVSEVSFTVKPASPAVEDALAEAAAALPLAAASCFFSDGHVVPVKVTSSGDEKDGKGKITVKTRTDTDAQDNDVLNLVCQPAP